MVSREGPYKTRLTNKLKDLFPGCLVLRSDANHTQGIPDILVLFGDRWAALEAKTSSKAEVQPNQPYWVELMNEMSFAAFIYPENEEEVLRALQQSFRSRRNSRLARG